VSAALSALAWQAAMTAWSWYGPGRPACSAPCRTRCPSAISARSQRPRVERPVAGGGGQPGAGTGGHAVALPRLQGAGERVLRALLGQVPVAGDRDQRGDDLAPLGLEGGADRRLDLRAGVTGVTGVRHHGLDEAIEVASKHPLARRGAMELRPFGDD
jgi:hypothetical protein